MKKISLLAIAAIFALSCSNDDDKKTASCNCDKVLLNYIDPPGVFDETSRSHYSNDCNDERNTPVQEGDHFYTIECTHTN